jgi:hypothetical protein
MRVGFQEDLDQLEASIHEEGTLALRSLRGSTRSRRWVRGPRR